MPESVITTPPSLLLIPATRPPAGSEWSYTIPANHVYLIHAIHFHFTRVAGGPGRVIVLRISLGADHFIHIPLEANVTIQTLIHHTLAPGLDKQFFTDPWTSTTGLPFNLWLPAEYTISTETDNIDPRDQYADIFIYVSPFILPIDRG